MSSGLYGQDFYNGQILGSLQSAQAYLYHLFSLWGVPYSVVDIGCGRGAWLATCRDFGVKRAVGIDGDWNSQEAMIDDAIEFHPANLEKRLTLADNFDLAISLEVAEHLQPDSSEDFVESLASLSDAVLFGAAFTGQPGVNHINTRPHSFWANKFLSRGYLLFDLFRPTFWNDDRVEPCYRQNTFLYVKPCHPLHDALVSRGYSSDRDARLIDAVHPLIYLGLLNEFNKLQQSPPPPTQEISGLASGNPPEMSKALPVEPAAIKRLLDQAEEQEALNRLDDATHTYRMALAQDPNNPECLLRLSYLLLRMKCHEECLHHARHFLRIVDDVAFGYYLAGHAARETGHWNESRLHLLRAVELDPTHVYARVLCCMSLFTVCRDQAEALSAMHTYAHELDGLVRNTPLETAEQVNNAVCGIGALAPFFLPYLGLDVTELQAKYGAWICSVMAAKYPQFILPLPRRSSSDRIKVGIISSYFCKHSNWKIPIRGWMEQLDRKLVSIHCFHTGDTIDTATETARSLADSFLQSSDIDTLAPEIHRGNFDLLIYPGIGMDTVTLKLAALRLAPVQCTSWGHPVTTGMPTVDYYLSSDLMEPLDGDNHYTEKLVRLPNLSVWCEPDEQNAGASPNLEIPGIEEHDVMFLSCQNILKYLPQHDHVFPAIAGQVKNARFVFIASHVTELTEKFVQRLNKAFQDHGLIAADHVTFIPYLNDAEFSALNARADIFLDSIGWSGCNTVFESLPFNTPIVTLPGAFMRSRHACAILRMMGVEDTIASNVDDYVSIAVRLAKDEQWRKDASNRISLNKHKVYRDRECIMGLEKFLLGVSGRDPAKGMHPHVMNDAEACNPDYWLNRGNLHYGLGHIDQAEAAYRQAITVAPEYGKAYYNLGNLLYGLGRFDQAEAAYRQAIKVAPEYGKAYYNLGILLNQLGRLDEARAAYCQAITLIPGNAELYCNLGDTLLNLGSLDEALLAYLQATTIKPDYAEAYNSLGIVNGLLCRLDESETAFRHAIAHRPDFAVAHSNLLLTLQYIGSCSHEKAFAEALNFGRFFEKSFKDKRMRHNNVREPGKRLKVGIVSGNLCDHPVGYFIEAVLQYFDREYIALYAYANQIENDRLGERLKTYFEEWLFIKDLSDEELASRIRGDGIDILIDLAGHTSGNRLLTFAYKPAPVQVTWLGYPNTTGLSSIDYILADRITIPPDEERFYTEKIWRLPDTYICFTPPDLDLEVTPLPALENGYVTFGSYNNPVKLTDEAIACWSQILLTVPDSVLLMKIRQRLDCANDQCDYFRQRFIKNGIDPARLRFEGTMTSRRDLIASYRRIDIALDPFPYNGTTTSCEAAWMGVPTLTLKMPRGIYSHNGELIMRSVGLGDWVADSVEGYVKNAGKVALDIARLAQIRHGLREQLLNSPICNAPRFANNLQLALRDMWQQWCV